MMKTRIESYMVALLFLLSSQAQAGSSVAGEYDGAFHGYLTVQPAKIPNQFKVWLGVGAGSCGGDVLINNKAALLKKGKMTVSHMDGKRRCTARIGFSDSQAVVSDTCITPQSEENSTCAMMGEYRRRISQ
jgi:hypothetical protein